MTILSVDLPAADPEPITSAGHAQLGIAVIVLLITNLLEY